MRKLPSNLLSLILAAGIAVAIARAQTYPQGFWGFILTNPYLLPALAVVFVFLLLYGVSGMLAIQKLFWRVFSFLVPQPRETKIPNERLKIHTALLGNGPNNDRDVRDRLQQLCANSSLDIVISCELLIGPDPAKDDPAPGEPKRLLAAYSFANGPTIATERPLSTRLILPEDPWLLKCIADIQADSIALRDCRDELAKQQHLHATAAEQLGWEAIRAKNQAKATIIGAIAPEARYLIDQLEQIKDWNNKEPPDKQMDLLYPINGNQIGEDRSKWRWQEELLIKWLIAYDRLCEYCKRLKLETGLPLRGSSVNYSKLIRCLSNVERGDFPPNASSEEI
jgi:hypothetical protein